MLRYSRFPDGEQLFDVIGVCATCTGCNVSGMIQGSGEAEKTASADSSAADFGFLPHVAESPFSVDHFFTAVSGGLTAGTHGIFCENLANRKVTLFKKCENVISHSHRFLKRRISAPVLRIGEITSE